MLLAIICAIIPDFLIKVIDNFLEDELVRKKKKERDDRVVKANKNGGQTNEAFEDDKKQERVN